MVSNQILYKLPKLEKFSQPSLTTDSLVLKGKTLQTAEFLLITRKREPYIGCFAFPGGFVDYNQDPMKGCVRQLEQECHLKATKAELFDVRGETGRDPRKHAISIIYRVFIPEDAVPKAGDDAATAKFYPVKDVLGKKDKFAFDHYDIFESLLKSEKII